MVLVFFYSRIKMTNCLYQQKDCVTRITVIGITIVEFSQNSHTTIEEQYKIKTDFY